MCPFCELIGRMDPKLEELDRSGVYHLEPLNPVVPGHRIFILPEHFARPHQSSALTGLIFTAAAAWGGMQNEDYNLIVNSGPDATQTVQHVHVHYVPRKSEDGLNLPWTDKDEH